MESSNNVMILSFSGLVIGYILFLLFVLSQIKIIKLNSDSITSIIPVFTFLHKVHSWKENDFYITIDEYSRAGTHEAVWIIRNEKVIQRFSSFYYSNYKELKNNLQIEYKGKTDIGAYRQVYYLLGGRLRNEHNR